MLIKFHFTRKLIALSLASAMLHVLVTQVNNVLFDYERDNDGDGSLGSSATPLSLSSSQILACSLRDYVILAPVYFEGRGRIRAAGLVISQD